MKKRKNIIEQQGPFSVSDFNPDFDQIGNLSQELEIPPRLWRLLEEETRPSPKPK